MLNITCCWASGQNRWNSDIPHFLWKWLYHPVLVYTEKPSHWASPVPSNIVPGLMNWLWCGRDSTTLLEKEKNSCYQNCGDIYGSLLDGKICFKYYFCCIYNFIMKRRAIIYFTVIYIVFPDTLLQKTAVPKGCPLALVHTFVLNYQACCPLQWKE